MDPKWAALTSLVLQNAGVAIMMRYSFVFANPDDKYIASTAVLAAEILKLLLSLILCFVLDAKGSYSAFMGILNTEGKSDWIKLSVPSMLYTLQNSLQYVSMSMLSAPVFQVMYQMKIITTAVFSVILLSRRISTGQWISLLSLAGGVALVQLSQQDTDNVESNHNLFLGLITVLCGCMTSGFAGVYFEMVLKSSKASIWLRNVQLSIIGIVMSSMAVYFRDSSEVALRGPLAGYNKFVWGVVIFQAAGGLIVALVVKHADNLLKGFATSISILLSCIVSSLLFNDVEMNMGFFSGATIVLAAVFGFGYTPPSRELTKGGIHV